MGVNGKGASHDHATADAAIVKQESEHHRPQRGGWFKHDQELGDTDSTNRASLGDVTHSADNTPKDTGGSDGMVVAIDDFGHVKSFFPGRPDRPILSSMAATDKQSATTSYPPSVTPVGPIPITKMASSLTAVQQVGDGYDERRNDMKKQPFSLAATQPSQGAYLQKSVAATPNVPTPHSSDRASTGFASLLKGKSPATDYRDAPLYTVKDDLEASVTEATKVIGQDRMLPNERPTPITSDYRHTITAMSFLSRTEALPSSATHAVVEPSMQVKLPNVSWSLSCKNVRRTRSVLSVQVD